MKPSARATARATVDLPAPAGPSMATSMAAATIGHVKLLRPLRERDFALLWTGMTVSLLGDGIFIVAEAWQVYDIENDPVALSLVGLAWTGGMTAFLLTGGIVSDRMERRRVLIAADLVRALVAGRRPACCRSPASLEIWHLVALAVLYGAGEAFFGPAFGALVPEIVAPHHLVRGQLAGPARAPGLRAAARARRWAARGRGRRRGRRLPGRRGHLRHERRVHLGAAGALAAAPAPSARRAASWARRSSSCARSRGCGRRWWRPR